MSATITFQDLNRLERLYAAGFHGAFLDNAIRTVVARQIARDETDLAQINTALAEFERRAGITSDEFFHGDQSGKMPDTADAMEWNALCKTRQRILTRLQILRSERG